MQVILRRAGQGQALVECLVIASAMLVLFLAVPILARYQDVRLAATAASRTLAFECTVRFEECTDASALASLQSEIRERHFARHDAPVLSSSAADGQRSAPAGSASGNGQLNSFWRDRGGRPILDRYTDVTQKLDSGAIDAVKGVFDKAGGLGRFASRMVGPEAFGLALDKGLMTAHVNSRVSAGRTLQDWLRKPEGMELSLGGRTAVLVDGWNAIEAEGKHPRSFESRVNKGRRLPGLLSTFKGGSETGHDGSTEAVLDALYSLVRLEMGNFLYSPLEPMGMRFRYHQIDIDVLPEDRIGTLK